MIIILISKDLNHSLHMPGEPGELARSIQSFHMWYSRPGSKNPTSAHESSSGPISVPATFTFPMPDCDRNLREGSPGSIDLEALDQLNNLPFEPVPDPTRNMNLSEQQDPWTPLRTAGSYIQSGRRTRTTATRSVNSMDTARDSIQHHENGRS